MAQRIVGVIEYVSWDCASCGSSVTVKYGDQGHVEIVCPVCQLVSVLMVVPKGSTTLFYNGGEYRREEVI